MANIRTFRSKQSTTSIGIPNAGAVLYELYKNEDYQRVSLKNIQSVLVPYFAGTTGYARCRGWYAYYHVPSVISDDEIKAMREEERYISRDKCFAWWANYYQTVPSVPYTNYQKSVTLNREERFGVIVHIDGNDSSTNDGLIISNKYALEVVGYVG